LIFSKTIKILVPDIIKQINLQLIHLSNQNGKYLNQKDQILLINMIILLQEHINLNHLQVKVQKYRFQNLSKNLKNIMFQLVQGHLLKVNVYQTKEVIHLVLENLIYSKIQVKIEKTLLQDKNIHKKHIHNLTILDLDNMIQNKNLKNLCLQQVNHKGQKQPIVNKLQDQAHMIIALQELRVKQIKVLKTEVQDIQIELIYSKMINLQ
ncbi:hypothetical protein IMG5_179940, partial [Ichthyophthirius multifiliis]